MLKTLYDTFRHWSEKGSVYIYSDTHFEDSDCKLMDPNWISPQEQVNIINKVVHKNDTLILLGDVGNKEWVKKIKAGYKVLITGNHDAGAELLADSYHLWFYRPDGRGGQGHRRQEPGELPAAAGLSRCPQRLH